MSDKTVSLVGIAGSLRRDSYNRKLLAAAQQRIPDGAVLEVMSIEDIPLYNADVESASGIPEPVTALKDAIARADGLVIATPEYNGSIPGVLKNAIDWVSRPSADIPRVLHGKPVALMGATPGGLGTVLSQTAWMQVLRHLRMRLWTGAGPLYVSSAGKAFDDDGLADAQIAERLETWLAGFVDSLRN